MVKKTAMQEIDELSNRLPLVVLEDINKRITDWVSSGGEEDDPYIHQQLRFARRVLKNLES
jgi:hypothetical protein